MSEWQPISTAPMNGTWVLLSNGIAVVAGRWSWHFRGWMYGADLGPIAATYWQPYPDPPALFKKP